MYIFCCHEKLCITDVIKCVCFFNVNIFLSFFRVVTDVCITKDKKYIFSVSKGKAILNLNCLIKCP